MSTEALSSVRFKLAEARHALRVATDYYHSARLRAEFGLIDKAGGDPKALGSSEDMRRRAFDAAVDADPDCQRAQDSLRTAKAAVERLEAELEILLDARRERDLDLREREIATREQFYQEFDPVAVERRS